MSAWPLLASTCPRHDNVKAARDTRLIMYCRSYNRNNDNRHSHAHEFDPSSEANTSTRSLIFRTFRLHRGAARRDDTTTKRLVMMSQLEQAQGYGRLSVTISSSFVHSATPYGQCPEKSWGNHFDMSSRLMVVLSRQVLVYLILL